MIYTGDCLEVMKGMPSESVDAVVTDPPAGIHFMSRDWDHDRGGRTQWVEWMTEVMAECHRLLKPGGHAVVWALPRTSHWTAWALEDARFEVRDCLTHIFASGFPKSHNLPGGFGTALKPASEHWWLARKPLQGTVAANVTRWGTGALNIDGARIAHETINNGNLADNPHLRGTKLRAAPQVTGFGKEGDETPLTSPQGRWPSNVLLDNRYPELFDQPNPYVVGSGATSESGIAVTRNGGGRGIFTGITGGEVPGIPVPDSGYGDSGGYSRFFIIPKADRAEREPVLRDVALLLHRERGECDKLRAWESEDRSPSDPTGSTSPARVISEGTSAGDSSSGTSQPGSQPTARSPKGSRSTTSTATSKTTDSITSSSLTPLPTSESTPGANSATGSGGSPAESVERSSLWGTPTGTSLEKAGPSTGDAGRVTSRSLSRRNVCGDCGKPLPRVTSHPTVKPIDLMAHLIKLVCPPGGVILDPFLGSGTTAIAAEQLGVEWIGIEKEPEYVAIAEARLNGTQRGLGLDVPAPTRTMKQGPGYWPEERKPHDDERRTTYLKGGFRKGTSKEEDAA